jgi:tetratricopeptide (TPR) repeat protein
LDVGNERQLWSEHYDCTLGELFEVRDDAVARIVGTVANQIEHDRMRRVRRNPTHSWDAYDFFLKGLEIYYGRWSAPDPPRACKPLFEKTTKLDPDFARAHAFLACVNAHMGQSERIDENFGISIDCARRAMHIDPLEADAPRILGAIYVTVGHHEEAYRQFSNAVRLNPANADLAIHMGRYHSLVGEPVRALSDVDRAQRLNPLHAHWYWSVAAMAHHANADYPAALSAIRQVRDTTAIEHLYAAACHAAMQETVHAHDNVAQALADKPDLDLGNVGLYLPYKDIEKREEILDQLARAGLPSP